ncbi:aminotransferase class IV [Polycladomyces sp. WAk]|uniref:Aminotransferase class IV n=1 Tax=Polycladomyces zharkentensis TaxID=2807616 RepID=A0ABS2WM44_9BACL|nr:aminotransferase class IV [Polycladomyces sp. WAk]MBN2910637.1 aminotransferase class IV [Polycladomyces sp. WAk]
MNCVWLNGKLVPENEAVVSVMDHGFLYGVGVFETLRVYAGHPFLLKDHVDRLSRGLQLLRIRPPLSLNEWTEAIRRLLDANELRDAYVRISVTGGAVGPGLSARHYDEPTTVIFVRPLPKWPEQMYTEGKTVEVLDIPRQVPGGTESLKSHNYLNSVLARLEMGERFPTHEGLQLSPGGWIAEGIVTNLFFVRDGTICTPSTETGILPGVTRRFVLELARQSGLPVEEGRYPLSVLTEADEIFLTNSLQEIVPVRKIPGWFDKGVGPVAAGLLAAYRQWTGRLWSVRELDVASDAYL